MGKDKDRIVILDFLRGIAALAVAFHHFFGILNPGVLRSMSYYGQLGVEVFFVISGFIIPYSLYRSRYTLRNYGTFVLKRIVRLDPPYLVTILLIIALGILSWHLPFQKDAVFTASLPQVLLHFAYVNVFFGYPWLNDVFWTLAIEFQYYLLIGLIFPLIFSRNRMTRLLTMAFLGALAFVITSGAYIFFFIFLFLMGISTCQYWIGLTGKREYGVVLALSTILTFKTLGLAITIVGFVTVCAILFMQMRYAIFHFLGSISYSLYLVHSPIGGRALNIFMRLTGAESMAGKLVIIALATGVAILAAYLLYRFVERPSQAWSASFRYHQRRDRQEIRPEETEQLNPAF